MIYIRDTKGTMKFSEHIRSGKKWLDCSFFHIKGKFDPQLITRGIVLSGLKENGKEDIVKSSFFVKNKAIVRDGVYDEFRFLIAELSSDLSIGNEERLSADELLELERISDGNYPDHKNIHFKMVKLVERAKLKTHFSDNPFI